MRWRRPYSAGPFHVLAGGLIAFGLAFFVLVLVLLALAPGAAGEKIAMATVITAFVLVWDSFLVRLFRIGIFVGEEGMQVRGLVRTVKLRWPEVRDIHLAPLKLPLLFWVPIPPQNLTIWIDRLDGPPIQTWVNNQSAEFFGRRRAFEHAFRALEQELRRRKGNAGEH